MIALVAVMKHFLSFAAYHQGKPAAKRMPFLFSVDAGRGGDQEAGSGVG